MTEDLKAFAQEHAQQLTADPAFRSKFLSLCAPLGVDPLQSAQNKQGGLSKMLGGGIGIGEFYNELSLKLLEICVAAEARTGGVIAVSEILSRLNQRAKGGAGGRKKGYGSATTSSAAASASSTPAADKYSTHDLLASIKKLGVLGSGIRLVTLDKNSSNNPNGTKPDHADAANLYVITTPAEFSTDSLKVLSLASPSYGGTGSVTSQEICANFGWNIQRVERAVEGLVAEGVAWIDDQEEEVGGGKRGRRFWFPSIWSKVIEA
jgi:ESCRT-II complex subunit VPS22